MICKNKADPSVNLKIAIMISFYEIWSANIVCLKSESKKGPTLKNWPLVKNPHFLSYPHVTLYKWLAHEEIIFTIFHEDCTKNVDFFFTMQICFVQTLFHPAANKETSQQILPLRCLCNFELCWWRHTFTVWWSLNEEKWCVPDIYYHKAREESCKKLFS